MGLFAKKDWRLVKWALPNEYIPLRCEMCGAIFVTKNKGPLGELPINYGPDYAKCRQCEAERHPLTILNPHKRTYLRGEF